MGGAFFLQYQFNSTSAYSRPILNAPLCFCVHALVSNYRTTRLFTTCFCSVEYCSQSQSSLLKAMASKMSSLGYSESALNSFLFLQADLLNRTVEREKHTHGVNKRLIV